MDKSNIKDALKKVLAEKGNYTSLYSLEGETSDKKESILAVLAEKGEYKGIAKLLKADEETERSTKIVSMIEPISALADLLTENSKGAFMADLEKRLDEGVASKVTEHKDELDATLASFKTELNDLLAQGKADLTTESLQSYKEAEVKLTSAMMNLAVETAASKAAELLPTISESARLTPDDIADIIDTAALTVESQIQRLMGEFIDDTGITADQITDFKSEVQKLIPDVDFSDISIDYSQVRNAPQGGTSAVLINQLIAKALEGFSGGSFLELSDTPASYTGEALKVVRVNAAEDGLEFNTLTGGGNAQTADPLSQFAATTSLQLKNTISDETGSGALVFGTSPEITTPTGIVKGDVGLSNVDNTTDAGKPVSTAQQTALNLKQDILAEGAFVDGDKTKLNAFSEANQTANNAKVGITAGQAADIVTNTAKVGITAGQASDITANNAKVTNANHTGDATGATALTIAANAVTNAKAAQMATKTYKGRTAAGTGNSEDVSVATLKSDLSLDLVTNTSDANKPVSTAQQTALNLKANLASPTFTGTPTLPTGTIATTQSPGNSTTAIATTAFATTALNLKANDSDVVKLTGNQTIAGTKTFSARVLAPNGIAVEAGAAGQLITGLLFGFPIMGLWNNQADSNPSFAFFPGVLAVAAGLPAAGMVAGAGGGAGLDTAMCRTGVGEWTLRGGAGYPNLGTMITLYQRSNAGTPEGVVTAPVGSVCNDTTNGILYLKVTGTGNTGWIVVPTQTALNLKANLASPTFTGTVAGITSTMVGLGNVNNTSNATERAAIRTVTNMRVNPRTNSTTTAATLGPDLSVANVYFRTTQTATLTISAPIGTPVIGEVVVMYIDAVGAETLTMNATYIPFGAAFETGLTAGKTLMITAQYNGTNWKTLMAVQQ